MKMKTTLPDELIVEILLRLPVRTLLRFKCVRKSWLFLISDPQFTKSHFDLAAAPTRRLLLRFSQNTAQFNSVDIEAPLHDHTPNVVFNIPPPSLFHEFGSWEFFVDVGSCRGFLLLRYRLLLGLPTFAIWNPSTGLFKRIKDMPTYPCLCGIGYDSSTDDYVIVNITLLSYTMIHCFSWRTNAWSCTKSTVQYALGMSSPHGCFINGALHWLVGGGYYDKPNVIIAYDVTERSLSDIVLPEDAPDRLYSLSVTRGCLCIFSTHRLPTMLEIDMWTLKEYKVQSSWTKSSFVLSRDYYDFSSIFFPIRFTRNDEIWLVDDDQTLVRFNDKGELLEHRVHGGMGSLVYRYWDFVTYRESLLPLPMQAIEDAEYMERDLIS
ncbi:F-box/kelch-repeat protein At3g06240-like [Glycine soja]|uniref:F-box/kelch-repeat protein n=1 Tax=Glycine soja TaxID=3848 RepID=A0A0B2S9Y7_GLYSO|nr:F-box/kelch-repeat protein At3g06240-like [Glycine soja]KHN41528.1 F-box/kelch-repeat protein [Glycine soja]RZB87038.1 F-box/kelch-repeat protein [Glycine soja]